MSSQSPWNWIDFDALAVDAHRVRDETDIGCLIVAAGRRREPPAMMRADHVTARHDAVGEVAAAMQTLALHREVAITVEAEHHRHALRFDGNHVAGLELAHFGNRVPLSHFRPWSIPRARSH